MPPVTPTQALKIIKQLRTLLAAEQEKNIVLTRERVDATGTMVPLPGVPPTTEKSKKKSRK